MLTGWEMQMRSLQSGPRKALRCADFLAQHAIVIAVVIAALWASTSQAALLFDDVTSSSSILEPTGSTPNTFMGDGYTLATGAADITGLDLFPVNLSGTNYTGLEVNIYVWGTVNTGIVSSVAPAFGNLLGSYTFTSTGTFTSGFSYPFESASPGVTPGVTLGTPLAVSSPIIGLTINYQGTTNGTTYASANGLTSLTSYGAAPTTGSEEFNGYYRNANSETNGNFISTLRSLGQNDQSLAVRIYGDVAVPEPAIMTGLALPAALGLLRRRNNG